MSLTSQIWRSLCLKLMTNEGIENKHKTSLTLLQSFG